MCFLFVYPVACTLPFDITATTKRVTTKIVDNLNMIEIVVVAFGVVGCELMITSSVQVLTYIAALGWDKFPRCLIVTLLVLSWGVMFAVCRVSNAICIIRAGMNETKLY